MNYTYGIYLYPDVASLDFVGPYEVFDISKYLLKTGRVVGFVASNDAKSSHGRMMFISPTELSSP